MPDSNFRHLDKQERLGHVANHKVCFLSFCPKVLHFLVCCSSLQSSALALVDSSIQTSEAEESSLKYTHYLTNRNEQLFLRGGNV